MSTMTRVADLRKDRRHGEPGPLAKVARSLAASVAAIVVALVPGSASASDATLRVSESTLPALALDGDALLNGLAAAAALPLGLLLFLAVRAALRHSRLAGLPIRRKVRVPAGRLNVATTPSEPIPPYQPPVLAQPAEAEQDRGRGGLSRFMSSVRRPSGLLGSRRPEENPDARLAWLREGEALREAGLFAEAEWKFQYGLEESTRNGWTEEIGVYERALERLASRPSTPRLTPVTARPGAREDEIASVLARVAAQREQAVRTEAPPERLRDHPPAHGRIATWEGDATTGEVRGSGNLAALWGVPQRAASTLATYLRRVRSDYRASVESAVRGALEVGEPLEISFPLETKGPDTRWLEVSILPVLRDGRTERWMGATIDITTQKRAEEDLRRRQDEASSVLDALPAIAIVVDASGSPVLRNAYWRDLVGDASLEDSSEAFLHPDDRGRWSAKRERGLAGVDPFEDEYRVWDAARGEHRWHHFRTLPLRESDGTIYRWLTVAIDVHDQRQAQVGLSSATRARDDFIDFVSHELSGPLTSLVEMSASLERRARAPRTQVEELRRSTEELHAAVEHLRDVVAAMVALARVGRDVVEPERDAVPEPTDLPRRVAGS